MTTPETLASDTVAALESAWADIADRNPDVIRDVVFITGSGRAGRRGGLKLGHVTMDPNWAEHRRLSSRAAEHTRRQYHEVFIAAETLAQHPVRLLQTLIHEAVHTIAITRGEKDTSRQNRYHNGTFRRLCEEAGLAWTHLDYKTFKDDEGNPEFRPNPDFIPEEPSDIRKNPRYITCEAKADTIIGFSDMHITRETAKLYQDTVSNLDAKVRVQQGSAEPKGSAPKKRRTVVVFRVPHGTGLQEEYDAVNDLIACGLLQDGDDTGEVRAGLNPQRLGVVVYEGLVARDLLTPHIAYIEEV